MALVLYGNFCSTQQKHTSHKHYIQILKTDIFDYVFHRNLKYKHV